MLRLLVLLLGVGLSLAGLLILATHGDTGAGIEALVLGLLVLIGTWFERLRYGESDTPPTGPDWERTDESFIDPGSGRPMVVYQHRRSGKRRYVPLA